MQQRQRLTLKLADNSQDLNSLEKRDPLKLNPHRKGEDADAHFEHEKNGGDSPIPNTPQLTANSPERNTMGGGGDEESSTPDQRANPSDNSSDKSEDQVNSDSSTNGGSSHGVGAPTQPAPDYSSAWQ